MLSHSRLVELAAQGEPLSVETIRAQKNIATYIARAELVTANEGPSRPDVARWLINLTSVYAFLETAESCIRAYAVAENLPADDREGLVLQKEIAFVRTLGHRLRLDPVSRVSMLEFRVFMEVLKATR